MIGKQEIEKIKRGAGAGRFFKLLCNSSSLIILIILLFSCAPSVRKDIDLLFLRDEDPLKKLIIINSIEERNRTLEDDPRWLSDSYERFFIKSLGEINEADYPSYSRYLENGSLYIIVHPAYYTFFQRPLFPLIYEEIPKENELERLLNEKNFSPKTALIKAQEKTLRDFLEYTSTTKRLVILILPGGYKKYDGYKFKGQRDEFRRYINEVTNESESVIYLYSKKPNRGLLSEKDTQRLLKFLAALKPKNILIGGGYLGRCIEDFWRTIEPFYGEKLYLVPELVAISPSDLGLFQAYGMLRPDGTVDVERLTENIRNNTIGNQEVQPRLRNINRE
ncbi:MAG: hypothetical protein N2257_04815 [Thermodesulfovibrionales bacterium]|nr:hypothetical protein [Thermodesulfovibrionales bacterium]